MYQQILQHQEDYNKYQTEIEKILVVCANFDSKQLDALHKQACIITGNTAGRMGK